MTEYNGCAKYEFVVQPEYRNENEKTILSYCVDSAFTLSQAVEQVYMILNEKSNRSDFYILRREVKIEIMKDNQDPTNFTISFILPVIIDPEILL